MLGPDDPKRTATVIFTKENLVATIDSRLHNSMSLTPKDISKLISDLNESGISLDMQMPDPTFPMLVRTYIGASLTWNNRSDLSDKVPHLSEPLQVSNSSAGVMINQVINQNSALELTAENINQLIAKLTQLNFSLDMNLPDISKTVKRYIRYRLSHFCRVDLIHTVADLSIPLRLSKSPAGVMINQVINENSALKLTTGNINQLIDQLAQSGFSLDTKIPDLFSTVKQYIRYYLVHFHRLDLIHTVPRLSAPRKQKLSPSSKPITPPKKNAEKTTPPAANTIVAPDPAIYTSPAQTTGKETSAAPLIKKPIKNDNESSELLNTLQNFRKLHRTVRKAECALFKIDPFRKTLSDKNLHNKTPEQLNEIFNKIKRYAEKKPKSRTAFCFNLLKQFNQTIHDSQSYETARKDKIKIIEKIMIAAFKRSHPFARIKVKMAPTDEVTHIAKTTERGNTTEVFKQKVSPISFFKSHSFSKFINNPNNTIDPNYGKAGEICKALYHANLP